MMVDPAVLTELAAPPCHMCGRPVARVEQSWTRLEDGRWIPRMWMVCASEHRVRVDYV